MVLVGRLLALATVAALFAPAAAEAQGAPEAALTRERVRAALADYAHEPSAAQVVRAAVQTQTADPARARDAMDRARIGGLLPTVRTAIRRGQGVDLSALTATSGDRTNVSTDDDLMIEGSLIFRFDRLVFAPEEPALLRELRALEQARLELVRNVVALYFERRRLQLEADLLGRRDLARAMRVLEIEALLDVFTAGAFTRMMSARRRESEPP